MTPHDPPRPRAFLAVAALLGCLLVAGSLFVASGQWFSRDDFEFLTFVQRPGWSWVELYLPFETRHWAFYRPLAAESFFYVCFGLFGFNATAFFAVIIAVHFLAGGVVYRLARQLAFDPGVAAVTALLSVSRYPSMSELYYASIFYHVGGMFFYVAAASLFVDYARKGRIAAQVGSCAALFLALLCAEFGVTLVALLVLLSLYLDDFELSKHTLLSAARRAAPQVAMAAAYLVFRFFLIAPKELPRLYGFGFGIHILGNAWRQLVFVFENEMGVLAAGLMIAAILAIIWRNPESRALVGLRLLRMNALFIPWIVVLLAPFAMLFFPLRRSSMPIEIPLCLLLGAYLDALWRVGSARYTRALQAGMICLLLVSMPYGAVWQNLAKPAGAAPERFKTVMQAVHPDPDVGTTVVFLYGAKGLAERVDSKRFRLLMFHSGLVQALYPGKSMQVRFTDVTASSYREILCSKCVYFKLRPGLIAEPVENDKLEREIRTMSIGRDRAAWLDRSLKGMPVA